MLTIDNQIILEAFDSDYFYGRKLEIVLPTIVSYHKYKLVINDEYYSPVQYAVAVYDFVRFEHSQGKYIYKLRGVEIK